MTWLYGPGWWNSRSFFSWPVSKIMPFPRSIQELEDHARLLTDLLQQHQPQVSGERNETSQNSVGCENDHLLIVLPSKQNIMQGSARGVTPSTYEVQDALLRSGALLKDKLPSGKTAPNSTKTWDTSAASESARRKGGNSSASTSRASPPKPARAPPPPCKRLKALLSWPICIFLIIHSLFLQPSALFKKISQATLCPVPLSG